MGIGYFLGNVKMFKDNGEYFIVGVVTLIVLVSAVPLVLQVFKEWQSKRYRPKSDS